MLNYFINKQKSIYSKQVSKFIVQSNKVDLEVYQIFFFRFFDTLDRYWQTQLVM